jgi:hypothetical protein
MFPGFPPGLDPSKMDPRLLGEISQLMATLPHETMMKMQTLMHNSMAGFDVRAEAEALERSLPSDFRAKLAKILYEANGVKTDSSASTNSDSLVLPGNVEEARLTILRAVRDGKLPPEDALKALFPLPSE